MDKTQAGKVASLIQILRLIAIFKLKKGHGKINSN